MYGQNLSIITRPVRKTSTASASPGRKKDIPYSPSASFHSAVQKGERQEHITISELVKKLIIPPEKRTEYDCKLMAKALYVFISSVAAFKEGFLKSDALAVARRAELQTVDAGHTVFLQGEVGGDFYFVLQGSVAIEINKKVIKILGDKTAFGELAMQCKCKRSASVLGAEKGTRLLVIRKKLYHRHLAKAHRREMASKFKFIKKLNASRMRPSEIANLCTCIKMQKVKRNQRICSTEEPAQFLYYLIEGSAEQHMVDNSKSLRDILDERAQSRSSAICKTRHVKATMMNKTGMFKETKDKKPREKNKPEIEMHRLATLLTGQMFGEASWVYGQQAMTTVVARSECKLWVISHAHVRKLVRTETQVQDHLEKMGRLKLQFRLSRLDTLNRARKSLQSARRNRGSKAWAGNLENKKSSSSWSPFVTTKKSVNGRSAKKKSKTPKRRRSKTECAQASSVGNFFNNTKPLPRVFKAARKPKPQSARKPKPYRNCDRLKYRMSDRYDQTNSVPRELLASVVDDFNSGEPELKFPQRQLVATIGQYMRRKLKRHNNKMSPKKTIKLPW